jgi:hypothetical protein
MKKKKYTVVLVEREAKNQIASDKGFGERLANAIEYSEKIGPVYVTAQTNTCAAEAIGTYEVEDSEVLHKLLSIVLRKK